MPSHNAAILTTAGKSLQVSERQTPSPSPHEVLISVKAVALNPVDRFQRDTGSMINSFPTVLGSDIAGTILSSGSAVKNSDLVPGTRVTAFASTFFEGGNANYGAFQEQVVVPFSAVCPLPASMEFNEAAMLPMAVQTAWSGYWTIGIPFNMKLEPEEKVGILIWGGASSVGSAAVQIAKSMGYKVYATASEKHHAYLRTLGASECFEYKDKDVVRKIVESVKKDGFLMDRCYCAANGALEQCAGVLRETKGKDLAKIANAPRLPENWKNDEEVEAKFVSPPENIEGRNGHFEIVFNKWLKKKLASGEFVASPKMQLMAGGLDAVNAGLDEIPIPFIRAFQTR